MVLNLSYHQFSAAGWEAVLENFRERVRGKIAGNALHINKIKDYYLQTSSKAAVKRIQRIVNQNVQKSFRTPHDHQVASTSHTESMSDTIRQSKTRYSTKHASPELRKSSKFAHAANLFVNSTDSSEEEIKANFEPLVTPNRQEASVEGNDDDKKGKKMKRKKSDHRGKLAKQVSKAHVEMCSKAMQMMDKIQNMLEKYDSNDTD